MEPTYERVPCLSSTPSTRPLLRASDPELGFSRYLSLQQVESCLKDRQVSEIDSKSEIFGSLVGDCLMALLPPMLVGAICTLFSLPISAAACDAAGDHGKFWCFPGILLLVGLSTYFLCFLCLACMGITTASSVLYRRHKQLKGNEDLDQEMKLLSFRASDDEPVEASDFIHLFRKKYLKPELLQELSFDQLRMIKLTDKEIFDSLFADLSSSQKGPWRKLDLIARSVLCDITESLNEDYIRTRLEDTPGFFEELMQTLPRDILEHSDASAALIDNVRTCISRRFATPLSDEQILKALQEVLEGGILENCLSFLAGKRILQLKCYGKSVSVSAETLEQASRYFGGWLRMHPEETEYIFDDLTSGQFETFIALLRGHKLVINDENTFYFLQIANYFDMKALTEACVSPLMRKLEGHPLEEKLSVIEQYPILTGRFKEQVDEEYAASLDLNIQKDRKGFETARSRARELGLNGSLEAIETFLENDIREWNHGLSPDDNLDSFLETLGLYHSVSSESATAKQLLKDAIHAKMTQNEDAVAFFFETTKQRGDTFLAGALLEFILKKENQDIVEGSFVALAHVIDPLRAIQESFC